WYADNTTGDFAPKQIVSKAVSGPSIALDSNGTPWVAFYQGNSIQAGWLKGSHWVFETVSSVGPCNGCPPLRTAIGFLGKSQPIVAFTDPKTKTPTTAVPAARGKGWSTSEVAPNAGGEGIAMAIDSKGIPHISYYTDNGDVEVASAQT